MGGTHESDATLPMIGIQSKGHEDLLNIIDNLRSQGISHYIDLPQLIVCGDQSSGKSSVLEAVSGLRFPTKDNLCTRFATELVLRRSPVVTSKVSIVPDPKRSQNERSRLQDFEAKLDIFEDFGTIVEQVSEAMGISENGGKAFSSDVLRVELTGPRQTNLTLVDLPGLFHSASKTQSDKDVAAVRSLVTSYMENPRSIILAVVSAKNDYNNQVVTKYARDFDPQGRRTLGVITKPDTLDQGSESEMSYFELAQNKDVFFQLGWHVLKNREFGQETYTSEQRDESEAQFFQRTIWQSLRTNQFGITKLRPRLSLLLQNQILTELPQLLRDVEVGIKECEDRLKQLGVSRSSPREQRVYLHEVSRRFSGLVKSAVDGFYEDEFFHDPSTQEGYEKRLRAVVTNILDNFTNDMHKRGHRIEVMSPKVQRSKQGAGAYEAENVEEGGQTNDAPKKVPEHEHIEQIADLIKRNRGRELPGFTKPETVTQLFRDQCGPWSEVVHGFASQLLRAARSFVEHALNATTDPVTKAKIERHIIHPALKDMERAVGQKILETLKQHVQGHPITFNHYFTENVQKLRQQHLEAFLAEKIGSYFHTDPLSDKDHTVEVKEVDTKALVKHLVTSTEPEMLRFACFEALHFMEAYYKVALKFFVDDFSIHVVEQSLLEKLPTIFDAGILFDLDKATIRSIAGETEESLVEREDSTKKQQMLQEALQALVNLDHDVSAAIKSQA